MSEYMSMVLILYQLQRRPFQESPTLIIIMHHPYIYLKHTSSMGRGYFAAKDIPPATTILEIEEEQFITYQNLTAHPLFNLIHSELSLSKLSLFAIYLAYCHANPNPTPEEELIKSYTAHLPNYSNNLICWHLEEIKLIKDLQLVHKISNRKQSAYAEYLKIQDFCMERLKHLSSSPSMKKPSEVGQNRRSMRRRTIPVLFEESGNEEKQLRVIEGIGFEDMAMFMALIESRHIYYESPDDSKSEVGALVPTLSFFNHSSSAQCEVEQTSTHERVRTLRSIREGEQVFVDYGRNISTLQFLENYGFLPHKPMGPPRQSPSSDELQRQQSDREWLALEFNALSLRDEGSALKSPVIYQS